MRRRSLASWFVLAVLAAGGPGHAASAANDGELRKSARRDATLLCDSFVRGDVEQFFAYTHPGLIALMGGKQAAAPTLAKAFAEMRAQNLKVLEVGRVQQVAEVGAEVQVILPIRLQMDVPEGQGMGKSRAVVKSHMLGVSSNGGARWTFVDLNRVGADEGQLRQIVPRLSPSLKLPAPEPPSLSPR